MKILFIGGILPEKNIKEIISNSKKNVDFAAHNFQKKLICGLDENNIHFDFFSVPFISSFPKYYKKIKIKKETVDSINYVGFINLPYLKIFSRYLSLKKELKKYLKNNNDFNVMIYSLHFPFIRNTKLIKKKFPNCKISLIVPDLQEYMSDNKTLIYRFLKTIEIKKTRKYIKYFDNFVFLTEYMNERVNIYNKPYTIVEGIANGKIMDNLSIYFNEDCRYFAYTGTLALRYGIMNLVNAFLRVKNPNVKLIICGHGEMAESIKKISMENSQIVYKGLVSPDEADKIQKNAFALVNPRQNNEEYTKYSFPSKIMEYISTGKPVVCYKLDGFPKEYDDLLIYPKDNSIESLTKCLEDVFLYDKNEIKKIYDKSREFLKMKSPFESVKKILTNFEKE